MRSTAKRADGCLKPLMARYVELAALGGEVLRQRLESLLPFPIVVGREEGGNDEVAIAASRVNKPVGGREPLAQESFGRAVGRFANLSALVHRPIELPLDGRPREVALFFGLPVEAQDLRLTEPDQRVPALEGMVEESERVVLRQGGQPQGQLG